MTNLAAYRKFWHPLALASEITEKPTRVVLLGEELVVYRTRHGVSAFKDVCPHRGCALSLGKIVADKLECPYHGWQYDYTGKCVRIPALAANSPIPSKARAMAYETREVGALVWAALGPAEAPFPAAPAECTYGLDGLRSFVVNTYTWTADAGRVVENFLDVSHFAFVHDGTLGERDRPLVTPHEVHVDKTSFYYTYPQLQPTDPTTGGGKPLNLNFFFHAPFSAHIKREASEQDWSCVSLYSAPITEKVSRTYVTFVRNFDLDPESDHKYRDFVDGAMLEDGEIVQNCRPDEIPVDLRAELHIAIPDAAGLQYRRILSRIEASFEAA